MKKWKNKTKECKCYHKILHSLLFWFHTKLHQMKKYLWLRFQWSTAELYLLENSLSWLLTYINILKKVKPTKKKGKKEKKKEKKKREKRKKEKKREKRKKEKREKKKKEKLLCKSQSLGRPRSINSKIQFSRLIKTNKYIASSQNICRGSFEWQIGIKQIVQRPWPWSFFHKGHLRRFSGRTCTCIDRVPLIDQVKSHVVVDFERSPSFSVYFCYINNNNYFFLFSFLVFFFFFFFLLSFFAFFRLKIITLQDKVFLNPQLFFGKWLFLE